MQALSGGRLDNDAEKLLELLRIHKSVDAIPEESLVIIGYIRDRTGRIIKKDILPVEIENEEMRRRGLEKKTENKPFGLIEVDLLKTDVQFRRVPEESIRKMEELIETYSRMYENIHEIVAQDHPIWIFEKVFTQYILGEAELSPDEEMLLGEELFQEGGIWLIRDNFPSLNISQYTTIIRQVEIDDMEVMTSEKAQELYSELERLRGTLTDTPRFKKSFQSDVRNPYDEVMSMKGSDISNELTQKYTQHNVVTLEDFILHHLKRFLKHSGLSQIANKVEGCTNFSDFIQRLESLQADDFPSGNALNIITAQIKTAAVEEKKELSQRKKQLSDELKSQKKIIRGMMTAISPYQLVAPFFKKFIEEMQSYLVAGKGLQKETKMYLDGTPHESYDRNPGKISGDCTEDHPLPFDCPEIPVYNIKVFDEDQTHIGNIYLLSTTTTDTCPNTCWHLEAIQIPGRIDWETGVASMIQRLGMEAEKKGINMITINKSLPSISNYDYIQTAFFDYQEKVNLGSAQINIPDIIEDADYSSFQGDGEVFIIWKK